MTKSSSIGESHPHALPPGHTAHFHLAAKDDNKALLALSLGCNNGSARIMHGEEGAGQIAQIRLRQPCEQRIIASVLHACLRLRTIFAHRGAAMLEPESGVESVFFNELVMTSLLDDPAMI